MALGVRPLVGVVVMDGLLASTGIGSLPFLDIDTACRFVADARLDLSFWPQLPRRDFRELMVPQFAEALPCLQISLADKRVWLDLSDPDRKADALAAFYERYLAGDLELGHTSPEHAAGLYAFLDELSATGRRHPQLKGHVTGPMTMALGLNDQDQRPICYDADVFDCVIKLVEVKARWQAARLRDHCDRVVILLDEPVLSAFGSSAYVSINEEQVIGAINQSVEPLQADGVVAGVHCCGNTDWAMFLRSRVDVVSFDAFQYAASLALYPEALAAFLDRGGLLAWGLVPTLVATGTETVEQLHQVWADALDALTAKGIPADQVVRQSLLTPSCGTGSLSEPAARTAFKLLAELRDRLKTELG